MNYLSVIAVNQERVISLIEHQPKDGLHCRDGDGLFLGALHIEDMVLDAMSAEESIIALGEILLDQCAKTLVSTLAEKKVLIGITYTIVFSLRPSMNG